MDIREVTHVSRNADDTIQALGNPAESWSPRSRERVVDDIDGHIHSYYARQDNETVEIGTVHTHTYLRTKPDGHAKGNLSDLPELPTAKDLVGYFKVTSGELIISDPCYELGTWCAGRIKGVKNGNWRATVEVTPDGRTLIVTHEKEKYAGDMQMADFEVGVDSAQAGIFCANAYPSEEKPKPGFYKACCDAPRKAGLGAAIVRHRGVVMSTDDGNYRAFVGRNKEKLAVAIRLEVN